MLGIALLLATTLASDGPAAPGRAEAPRHGAAEPRWTETAWPFPMDQWGTGRAFRCAAADCGSDIAVYVRPKIGFCNCTTGVADDEEMDRVGDVDLLAPAYGPAESGRPHPVGDMVGWSRAYALGARRDPAGIVLAVAFSAQCNVMVATAVGGDGITPAVRDRVRAFLDAAPTLAWARRLLGS
ncbi:hypothetical protein [Rhodoplanes roseus]|uniref:Uncharacterized protein n=1 Tax=Rhodoplanes roseus TaxID=29409 RepID=A0A327L537_9BRAD|nr:hypothetical protein [Rhodoplanes roseus]RAI45741.1 hypothetical protein CH341_02220 [Rhodoplanes roseus]